METRLLVNLSTVGMVLGLVMPQISQADENSNAVSLGYMANPIGSQSAIAYERMVAPGLSVGARFSNLSYDYWDGGYNEWGSGSWTELTLSHHFQGDGFSGPYLGVAFGQASVNWDWYEYPGLSGYGTSKLTSFVASFGWDVVTGSENFIIRPAITLGSYSGAGKDNTGTKTGAFGAIVAAGVAAMLVF